MPDPEPRSPLGAKMAERFARNAVNVRGETLRMENANRTQWLTATMETMERELAPIVAELLGHIGATETMPPRWQRLIGRGSNPTHQVDFILNLVLSVVAAVTQLGAFTLPVAQGEINHLWTAHTDRPLDPGTAALGALRGATDYGTARDYAAQGGFSTDAFAIIYKSQIAPPPVDALLTMLRRGLIQQGDVETSLGALGVDTAYVPALTALALGPPSGADAILGVVQNHLDEASARTILKANGVDPSYYDWLYQNAGRPPGPMELISAWNRGNIDQATVEQGIRESDIKDKYVSTIVGLREHLLPQKTIVAGVHQGVIDDTTAMAELLKLGISPQNAGFLLAEGHNLKTAAHKTVSVAQIEAAYEAGSLTRADAEAHLVTLGYAAADADFILNLVDVKWAQALHTATVSRIRSQYLAGTLTRTAASSELDTAGVTSQHRDLYLQQWDIAKATPTRTLTEAQASNAYRRLFISEVQFRGRLTAMGFDAADVDLVVLLTPRPLTQAQAIAGYVAGILTETELRGYLTAEGLTVHDQDIIIAEHPLAPSTGA